MGEIETAGAPGVSKTAEKAEDLKQLVITALREVIDPETCQSVWDMKLVRDIRIKEGGLVELVFRPSSRICPLAFALGAEIKAAVNKVAGIGKAKIIVENFNMARELEDFLGQSQQ